MENKDEIIKGMEIPIPPKVEPVSAELEKVVPQKHVARSLETDMATEIKDHQGSIVQIAIAENEKKKKVKEITSIKSKKNIFFLSTSILFLIVAFIFIFLFLNSDDKPIKTTQNISSQIITPDEEIVLDLSGLSKIKTENALINKLNTPIEGTVKNILLVEKGGFGMQKVTFQRFSAMMEFEANEKLFNSLSGNFMIGSYECPANKTCSSANQTFMILKSTDKNAAFTGMKNWENQMEDELSGIFKIKRPNSGLNSSYELSFQDGVVDNKPARILENSKGETAGLIYIFSDTDIIISDGEEAIIEVVSRLKIQ